MVVSSTLVNVAEDAELRLVTLLGESAGESFQDTCAACLTGGDAEKLVKTILSSTPAMQALMQLDTDEAVAAVALLATLLQKTKTSTAASAVASLVSAISGKTFASDDLTVVERKLNLLSVLYNMMALEKTAILTRMIELAGTHAETLLAPDTALGQLLSSADDSTFAADLTSPRVVTLLDSWQASAPVSVKDRRMLYTSVCAVMPDTDSRKQRFLLLLVETYTSNNVDAAGLSTAKDAAVGAIRDPVTLFRHQRNLLSRPAVQALQKDHADLLGLLKVFQEGKLTDYDAFFAAKNEASVLEKWGLDSDTSRKNMRILSLCSLAAEHEEIPYTVIAETLKCGETTNVETWVIAAVNSGLLQAKMDQLAQKVMVERCVVRRFDMEQWKSLQTRLSAWKENVGGVLAALKQSQAAAASASAAPATN